MSTAPETRARLIDQGRIAFAAKGHDRVSLQRDVLEPSGVSTGSFYHQFKDKTELLIAVLEDAHAKGKFVVQHSLSVPEDAPPVERLRERIKLWLELVEAGEDLFRIQIQEQHSADDRVRQLVAEARSHTYAPLVDRLNQGVARFSDSFDSNSAVRIISGLLNAAMAQFLDLSADERAAERDPLSLALAEFIVGGVANMAGLSLTSGVAAK